MSNPSPSIPLPWSARLTLAPPTASLSGDKVLLPQSALEQLLSAAATAAAAESQRQEQLDPESWAPPPRAVDREDLLPHPLIVRLESRDTGKSVYAVPREFSAAEGTLAISEFLREALGIPEGVEEVEGAGVTISVEAASLPKGMRLRLRPLEAGYDEEDWKPILEAYIRARFATLDEGVVLDVPRSAGSGESWRFLVDEAVPGGSVCLIDTDVEVSIVPLSEDQARETLRHRQQRKSAGGKLKLEEPVTGEITPGEYHFYDLETWDKSAVLVVELEVHDIGEGEDVDLFVATDRQHHKPRIEEHIWGDLSSSYPKRLTITPGNVEIEDAKRVSIGVRGWIDPDAETNGAAAEAGTRSYSLRTTQRPPSTPADTLTTSAATSSAATSSATDTAPSPDHKRCKNCHQWIPARTMILHENFCLRNNVVCPMCKSVFKRGTESNHWHCADCSASGNTPASQSKHHVTTHTIRPCNACPYTASSLPDLATHRTSTCPAKLILCRFCHLLVPQGGDGDGSAPNPEAILSGLAPHELECGARTTECSLCTRRIRLRDLDLHLKQHDLSRLAKPKPRVCANPLCTRPPAPSKDTLGLCEVCFGPLYTSSYDPDGAGLRKRVERKLMQQLLSGCRKEWCRNEMCKTGREHRGLVGGGGGTKEALPLVKPVVERLAKGGRAEIRLCVDENSQYKRDLAEALQAESVVGEGERKGGYAMEWCIRAVEEGRGNVGEAKKWLEREGVREGER